LAKRLRVTDPRSGDFIANNSSRQALDIGALAFQAFAVVMKIILLRNFLAVCACVALSARLAAAETNSVAAPLDMGVVTQNVVNGYLQIQAQLHDTQLAIEDSRREAADEAKRNTDTLTARIQTLEATIATQRASEVELAQKNQQFMLTMGAAFGLIVLGAVLFMVYLQGRAMARVVELCAARPQEFSLGNGHAAPSLVTSATVEQSNVRLFSTVDSLQKRILELEQGSRAMLAEKTPATMNGSHKISETKKKDPTASDREECVANLLTEGQALLDAHEPEKALECFDVALGLDSKHAEALVKKGGALEKLGRTDEAIACYDHAIEANRTLTIAHLHKGGLFNRMARYDEALQCYEEALRTQENKLPGGKAAA
jgi:tetratricopeptide (TPR) repeat protein